MATIWMNAAIGAAIGLGYYAYALVCTILCMIILFLMPMATPRRRGHRDNNDHHDEDLIGQD
jgi:uncharacterized membrane protein YhiD involved in acid resistance